MGQAFVVWDTTTTSVKTILDFVAKTPPEGWQVVVGGARARSGDLWKGVERDMKNAARVVALVDKPNANVGFEIGYALSQGLAVVLGAGGATRPDWVNGRLSA